MKTRRIVFIVIVAIFILLIGIFAFNWIRGGNQYIDVVMPNTVYSNADFSIQVSAKENYYSDKVDSTSSAELLDNDHKNVKNVKIVNENGTTIISVPNVESGTYYLKIKVSSELGTDTIEKAINISNKPTENVTITFDKGIYKPGDVVNYRALILNKNDNTPIKTTANISIYDGNDNRVYLKELETSDYGIVFGSFKLGKEVNSGLYRLVVKTDKNEFTKQFKVNPYVLPKYEVTIKTDKDNYLVNEKVEVTADAKYFFGEPVTNAEVSIYVNGEAIGIGKTDANGIATKYFEGTKNEGVYSIKVEAQDASNYYVEAESSFVVGQDLIKIEMLPEYGNLVAGEKNKIYVLTKDAYGTPIKTYLTVSAGTFKKQVITDEKGVGIFEIDIPSSTIHQSIVVNAENMNGDITFDVFEYDTQTKDVLIKTDKVKYNEGEEITLKVDTPYDDAIVYVAKGDNVLKILSNVKDEVKFDLGDNFGLIDIFVKNKNSRGRYYDYDTRSYKYDKDFSFKKTIFIAPNKSLNISIDTDKTEYKPGENIKLSFNVKDENNTEKSSALLVSMLDNSILNLADNDLSIDNIRLALEGIRFSEDIDAATLYSAVMNEQSEQQLVSLLLKQGDKSLNINTSTQKDNDVKDDYSRRTMITILLLFIFLVIWVVLFAKKAKAIIGEALNSIVVFGIIALLFGAAYTALDRVLDISYKTGQILTFFVILSAVIAAIALYLLVLRKFRNQLSRVTIFTIISYVALVIISMLFNSIGWWTLLILGIIIIAMIAIECLAKKRKFKNEIIGEFIKKLSAFQKNYLTHVLSLVVFVPAYAIFCSIVMAIINDISYSYWIDDVCSMLLIAFGIIVYYLINIGLYKLIIPNNKGQIEKENEKDSKVGLGTGIIIGVAVTVIIVVLLSIGVLLYNQGQSISITAGYSMDSISNSAGSISSSREESAVYDISPSAPSDMSSSSSVGDMIGGLIFNATTGVKDDYNNKNESVALAEINDTESSVDNHIRNVFLESMCFVPELIAENGKADLDLVLSDNITTWTVQVVGNTKDGNVGFGKIDNVKVFKEFFADFELPKNLVKGDKVSIPVTVYNYTEGTINVALNIKEQSWFKINSGFDNTFIVNSNETKLVYIPIDVVEVGTNTFRVEVSSSNNKDTIEKTCEVVPNGFKVEKLVTSGVLSDDVSDDILLLDSVLDNSAKAKVKIYSNTISQTVEGVENILRMPNGCFEQVSSSLYPDIVALRYLEDNRLDNEALRQKALEYISTGYQKLLSYEVNRSGGFSLYGYSPAETVLTAYGLMEFKDLQKVYDVDENLIDRTTNYLYGRQNSNGSFSIEGYHVGGLDRRDELSENAYIAWALSEVNTDDSRLKKSIDYLSNNISKENDAYTLALIANALVNCKADKKDEVISKLIDKVVIDGDKAYVTSSCCDYWGSYGARQNSQATALLSIALSKNSSNYDINKKLINYLVSDKDFYGTWYSTQNTVLCLKALNEFKTKETIQDQTIKIKFNDKTEEIRIDNDALDVYSVVFNNVSKENKLNIDFGEGEALYEVALEYYRPYEEVDLSKNMIQINVEHNNNLNVNDILNANVTINNNSNGDIINGMIVVNIPQGFVTIEDSLNELVARGLIEKYETNYRSANLYIRGFNSGDSKSLNIKFRASYPVNVTGMGVRAYDYYNPDIEGYSMPKQIIVK